MAHKPTAPLTTRDEVEPLIPKTDVAATLTHQDYSAVFLTAKVALWFISLTAALSSYHTYKSTIFYKHFNLQRFDHGVLIPITIILLHAILAYATRFKYLVDMRGPNRPHWFYRMMEDVLQAHGMVLMMRTEQRLNDSAMMITLITYSIFLMCLLNSVAPGFRRVIPLMPAVSASLTAYRVSRLLEFSPFFVAIVFVTILLMIDDDRVKHQRSLKLLARMQEPCSKNKKDHETVILESNKESGNV